MSEIDGDLDIWTSSNGDDSNAILLPQKAKKSKTNGSGGNVFHKFSRKGNARGGEASLSKSKQRKLKQLQEEKEKKALLAESIRVLQKYKIRDEDHSLLRSSGTIGQAQTMREKRLRAAQFSKAGLEVPEDTTPSKRRKGAQDILCSSEEPDVLLEEAACENNCQQAEEPGIDNINIQHGSGSSQKLTSECPYDNINIRSNSEPIFPESTAKETIIDFPKDQKNAILIHCCNGREQDTKSQDQERDGMSLNCQDIAGSANVVLENPVNGPTVVHVSRPKEVEENRTSLPIVMMEQEIMEAINENSAVIICGETGCGKTTQVPQFLYEAGFGSDSSSAKKGIIGITQPRRVAVLATAKRVSFELGLRLGKEVGYQVRHDKMIGEKCSIKFMTDGILLRELQSDFLLKKYSVILLDEAHERSLNTDILIGMLSRITILRQQMYLEQQRQITSGVRIKSEDKVSQLKLILMSATLRIEDFISDRRLFHNPPPIIEVPTRQFPVTTHFSKRTDLVDYVGQAYKKVLQIHKSLPPGGILVFVTGQREVEYLCKKLRKASKQFTKNNSKEKGGSGVSAVSEGDAKDASDALDAGSSFDQEIDIIHSYEQDHDDPEKDSYSSDSDEESELLVDSDDEDSTDFTGPEKTDSVLDYIREPESFASLKASFDAISGKGSNTNCEEKSSVPIAPTIEGCPKKSLSAGPLYILPLYARLPASSQLRVFEDVREGERLVVVATNVAETSLTIPGIKYVVDTGREKVRNYSYANGMESYEIQWISKASASQRAGRAGRTGPGHCYRLYSAAAFSNKFPEFSSPQITKIPVDGVVLLMKFMGISKVVNFPFPTPPETTALVEAERCLKALEALDIEGRLTAIGKVMAQYPMSPRHSRMILTVIQFMSQLCYDRANLVLGYTVAAAAALSFPNPFNMDLEGSQGVKDDLDQREKLSVQKEEKRRQKKLRAMVREAQTRFCNPSSDALTISNALQQFELAENPVEFCNNNSLQHKTMDEMSKLRKQLLQLIFSKSGTNQEFTWNHGDHRDVEHAWKVSFRKQPLLMNEEEILGQAICTGWADRVAKCIRRVSELSEMDQKAKAVRYQSCALNETVFLHGRSSVSKTAPEFLVYTELLHSKRPYMHGVTSVKSDWLIKCASSLCNFSAPLTDPKPYYDPLTDRPLCWVSPTFGPHLWQLPLHSLPIKDDMLRVSVFACALLEGNVLPCFKSVQKFLAAPPSSILRPEASGQRRVGHLLNKLKSGRRTIDGRAILRDTWKENPQALYPEILCWFQEKFHNNFEELWARMHSEVVLQAHELFPKWASRSKKSKRIKK